MQTAAEYLARTESAVRHLFNGIDAYHNPLRSADIPVLVKDEPFGTAARAAEQEDWIIRNEERFAAAWEAEKMFLAELFAIDTLCGAVLQVADKALDLYGKEVSIPPAWSGVVKKKEAKYCCGRLIRTVPLGLVIYAARNQHTHFEDLLLREPNATVFKRLATAHGYPTPDLDSRFALPKPSLTSSASDIVDLIRWRMYDQYENDMRALLEI